VPCFFLLSTDRVNTSGAPVSAITQMLVGSTDSDVNLVFRLLVNRLTPVNAALWQARTDLLEWISGNEPP
jgi:hypothetical protein